MKPLFFGARMRYIQHMTIVRAAMIGDVVGEPGLEVLEARLPALAKEVDFITVNGENAADGFGITEEGLRRIIAAGADIVTSGNHVWEKRDFWPVLDSEERVIRPANYPPASPGVGWARIEKANHRWVVVNLQGREFMSDIDCPFRCFDQILDNMAGKASDYHQMVLSDGAPLPGAYPIILIDFHAESSREKEALAYYVDGRASLIAGTHTHVQTADERILPKGSAYITDLGMTGITNSVIGMDPKICMERVRKQVLYRMEIAGAPADGMTTAKAELQGIIAEFDADTGKAVSIRRI